MKHLIYTIKIYIEEGYRVFLVMRPRGTAVNGSHISPQTPPTPNPAPPASFGHVCLAKPLAQLLAWTLAQASERAAARTSHVTTSE